MIQVEYGKQILEFPDGTSEADMEAAIVELPEEKASSRVLLPSERFKAGRALKRINPTVAREVRRIALERRHGYIAEDPFSVRTMIGNIPENVEDIVTSLSSIIAQTGLFAHRFGRNIMQDGNEAIKQKHHPILPGMGPRVQEQFRPAGNLIEAIYADWKAMFAGEVSDEIGKLPVGQMRDALWDSIERQGIGSSLKYFIQDSPVDALMVGSVLKSIAAKGGHLSLKGIQKTVPRGTRAARVLDDIISTKRTPILYTLGPEKNLAKISAKVQKDTATLLKPTSDIGGLTLDGVTSLAATDPLKAVQHIRRAKIPYAKVIEGLRNKGAKVVMAAPKAERGAISKKLQLTIDRVEKLRIKKLRKPTVAAQQVNVARKTGGSNFSREGNLVGTDSYAVPIFPEHSKIVNGKVTREQLAKFYVDNKEILTKHSELTVGTRFDNGKTYIDLSALVPITNKHGAIELARKYNQETILNLKTLEKTKIEGIGLELGKLPNIEQRMQDISRISPPKPKPEIASLPGEKVITFERKYSDDLLTKYIFEKTFDAALEKFPAMKQAFTEHKAKKLINTMRNASDQANFNERVKMHEEIYSRINTLSKEEQAVIIPYLEGRAQLIQEPGEQFRNFEIWYRQLIDTHETHLLKAGKLPGTTDRLYQPIAKATGQTIEQVKAEMGTFTPVYVHHTFPKLYDEKMGIHFAETTGKRFRPGFMKKCKGVQGYSENFKEILPKYTSEYIKFKHTEQFITDFTTKFGIKTNLKDIKVVEGVLQIRGKSYPEYKIVAPDGYLSFYRAEIDLQKEIMKHMETTTFDEAVGDILTKIILPIKEYTGVSKNKIVYLVPEKIVGELESFATPIFGSQKAQDVIRLVVDKPTQIWKDSVLAVSPRWMKNNVMGDIIFNSFEGVGPLSYSRAFRTVYKDCIPDELLKASFANVMKYNPKLGKTAKTTIGKYVQALSDSKIVSNVAYIKDTGYALNTMLEQPFVRALYVKLAREKAVHLLKTEGVSRSEANILAKMRAIKGNELLVEPLINKVHEILPVFNLLGNFERKYIRRFVPFVNWYKFMLKYGAKLPGEHPFKLIGARGIGALSEEQREQVFKDYFPFMAREIEDAGIPERFDHLWPIGQKGEQMAKFFNVRGANPFTTIEDFVNLDFINMASPILTVPVEQMTGRAVFGGRKFESGEAGITVTHKGVEYEEFAKVRPPLVDHILSQMPQYTLLKKWLVPARQWDTGTLLNPDPMLNPDTGEYVYPIESVEKILNMLGVDQKTLDIQKVWYKYQTRKAQALGRALAKHRENLSFEDIRGILHEIQKDSKLWEQLRNEINEKAHYEEEKTREFLEKVK